MEYHIKLEDQSGNQIEISKMKLRKKVGCLCPATMLDINAENQCWMPLLDTNTNAGHQRLALRLDALRGTNSGYQC